MPLLNTPFVQRNLIPNARKNSISVNRKERIPTLL